MKKAILSALIICLAIMSCSMESVEETEISDLPECWKRFTDAIAQKPVEDLPCCVDLYSYTFEGQTVVVLPTGDFIVDAGYQVMDLDCVGVCIFGAMAGNTCNEFLFVASDKTLFWEDPR